MTTRGFAAAVGIALLLALPAGAEAEKFVGQTSQGLLSSVRTNRDGEISFVRMQWKTADCSRPGWRLKRTNTLFVPPLDRSRPSSFVDGGTYKKELPGYRMRYSVEARGRMRSPRRWRGTFVAKARVRFPGGGEMTCRLRRISWSASLKP